MKLYFLINFYLVIVFLFENFLHAENVKNSSEKVGEKRKLKILVTAASVGWSHIQYQGKLADVLTDAGHDVHIFNFDLCEHTKNYTGTTKGQIVHQHTTTYQYMDIEFGEAFEGMRNYVLDGTMDMFFDHFYHYCKDMLQNDALLNRLKEEHFDIGIAEHYDYCSFGIFHKAGIRTKFSTSALPMSSIFGRAFGIPYFNSYNLNFYTNAMSTTLWNRLVNFLTDRREISLQENQLSRMTTTFQNKFGADFPDLHNVVKNISLLFANANEFFTHSRATSHKIIYVGGITQSSTIRPLSAEFQKIIDSAKHGVILFSFGTFVNPTKMSLTLQKTILRAFAKFPHIHFIWKFKFAQPIEIPSNVHIFDWVDQRAILAHPKLRAFISHTGLNSANEAAVAGVPVIALPLLFDQPHNAECFTISGSGIVVDIRKLPNNEQLLIDALTSVLNNPIYAEKAKILKQKFVSTPFSPKERLVKWVEFAGQFPELNELNLPQPEELGLFKYYNIDVVVLLGLAVLLSLYLALLTCRAVLRFLLNTSIRLYKLKAKLA